jgi:uncharacterized membrane protein YqjE
LLQLLLVEELLLLLVHLGVLSLSIQLGRREAQVVLDPGGQQRLQLGVARVRLYPLVRQPFHGDALAVIERQNSKKIIVQELLFLTKGRKLIIQELSFMIEGNILLEFMN